MSAFLGLDVGRSQTRALAIDESGRVLASASADVPVLIPRPGWAEQNPADWWQASLEVLTRVGAQLRGEVAGLGITGQMHGSVFLDEAGDVIRPALLRNDERARRQSDEINGRIGAERLIEITGNAANTTYMAPKLLWLRDVEPVQFRHVRHLLLPKDYLRLRLTGELATDVSDASGTLLFDLRRRGWSHQILAALDIPPEWLPRVLESRDMSGRVLPSVASAIGLPAGIPVAAGAGDTMAAALGAGVLDSELIHAVIGASGALVAPTVNAVIDSSSRLAARCHAVPQRFALSAHPGTAGASLRWWRNLLSGSPTYEQLATLGSSAPAGAEGLFFLPYLAAESEPRPATRPGGAFAGLRAHHSRAHLTRALMEGVVFGLRGDLDAIRGLGLAPLRVRATGGAARSPFWRQLQADIFNLPVERPLVDDGPAYGAALLAGVAAGSFEDVPDAARRVRLRAGVNEPDREQTHRYDAIYATFRNLSAAVSAVAPAMSWSSTRRYNPARGA